MRTTIDLDDDLHVKARRLAFEERRSIGDVISEWARRGSGEPADGTRPLGRFAGTASIADDFDDPLDEAQQSIDEPLT